MKTCTDCGQTKNESEFSINRKKKDGLNYRCKVCQRVYFKDYYQKNKAAQVERVGHRKSRVRKELQDWLTRYKSDKSCAHCGYNQHPAALHFHHLNPKMKDITIANAITNGWTITNIEKEIKKCIILCANCHAIVHYTK